jgi:hypothetical protein
MFFGFIKFLQPIRPFLSLHTFFRFCPDNLKLGLNVSIITIAFAGLISCHKSCATCYYSCVACHADSLLTSPIDSFCSSEFNSYAEFTDSIGLKPCAFISHQPFSDCTATTNEINKSTCH